MLHKLVLKMSMHLNANLLSVHVFPGGTFFFLQKLLDWLKSKFILSLANIFFCSNGNWWWIKLNIVQKSPFVYEILKYRFLSICMFQRIALIPFNITLWSKRYCDIRVFFCRNYIMKMIMNKGGNCSSNVMLRVWACHVWAAVLQWSFRLPNIHTPHWWQTVSW